MEAHLSESQEAHLTSEFVSVETSYHTTIIIITG